MKTVNKTNISIFEKLNIEHRFLKVFGNINGRIIRKKMRLEINVHIKFCAGVGGKETEADHDRLDDGYVLYYYYYYILPGLIRTREPK